MTEISSVVIALDGESKCGKTTIIENIAEEARFQAATFEGMTDVNNLKDNFGFDDEIANDTADSIAEQLRRYSFRNITTISAGNSFRAAALYEALLTLKGEAKTTFEPSDNVGLRELLALDGILETLQDDPNVGARVSLVGQFMGVQALCGAMFAHDVADAYNYGGGGNLVIIDARDPIGHLERNGRLGSGPNQIRPRTILPIYIDTPTDVAAERMAGSYEDNLKTVSERRVLDTTREELPVVRPTGMISEFDRWIGRFFQTQMLDHLSPVLRLDNGRHVDLNNIQYIGGVLAAMANDAAITSYAHSKRDIVDNH